jgi:hypothetical protein
MEPVTVTVRGEVTVSDFVAAPCALRRGHHVTWTILPRSTAVLTSGYATRMKSSVPLDAL